MTKKRKAKGTAVKADVFEAWGVFTKGFTLPQACISRKAARTFARVFGGKGESVVRPIRITVLKGKG